MMRNRADFSKVSDLVKKISDAKIGRRFESSDEVLARLSMYPPDQKEIPPEQKGTRILFKDKTGKELERFIIGSDAVRSDAFYIKRSSGPDIYLIDKEFRFLEKKPEQWIAKELLNVEESEIAQKDVYYEESTDDFFTIFSGAVSEFFSSGAFNIVIDLSSGSSSSSSDSNYSDNNSRNNSGSRNYDGR